MRENQHFLNPCFLTSSFKMLEISPPSPVLSCDLVLSHSSEETKPVPALETAAYQAFHEEGRLLRQSILAGTRTINSKALYFLTAFSFKN